MILTLLHVALAQDLGFGVTPAPGPKENPAFFLTPSRNVKTLYVNCEVGGKHIELEKGSVAAGAQVTVKFPHNEAITTATCFVRAGFVDGDVVEQDVPVSWTYQVPLHVDLSHAEADLEKKTVSVQVSGRVLEAEVTAYGVGKEVLDKRVVPMDGGPGEVAVPFVGNPNDVVLLDVTLRNNTGYSGFTYSPWFLDIPHDDVLFASDSDVIAQDQEWKLTAVLAQIQDILVKYGAIVKVKLFVGGCTDTVGDGGHNRDLSERRARAIATWFKGHGYGGPIFYYGFGESFLAFPTGDGVDNAGNRRALYLVGANPPPSGSGVPGASWKPL